MRSARSRVAAIAWLAAGAAVAFGQIETAGRARAADPVRARAEELAKEASQRFSEVLKDRRPAESPGKRAPAPSAGHDPWAAALGWLERSGPRLQVDRAAPQQRGRHRHGAGHAATQPANGQASRAGAGRRNGRAEGGRQHLGLVVALERDVPGNHAQARRGRGPSQRGARQEIHGAEQAGTARGEIRGEAPGEAQAGAGEAGRGGKAGGAGCGAAQGGWARQSGGGAQAGGGAPR